MDNETNIKEPNLSEKLENFWYHYKWHTIAAFFIVLVVVICSLQMCGKATYDVYVMYAGEMPIENTKADSNYHTMISALKLVTDDHDEDGAASPLLKNLLVPSGKEYDALADRGYDRLIASDMAEFEQLMVYSSEYYLCFLSEDTFREYDKPTSSGAYPFVSLTDLVPDGSDARLSREETGLEFWGYDYRIDRPDAPDGYFIATALEERAVGVALSLGARLEGELIGEVVFHAYDRKGGADFAFRLLPEYRGRGLGARLYELAVRAARAHGIVRLFGRVMKKNTACLSLIEKRMELVLEDECLAVFSLELY